MRNVQNRRFKQCVNTELAGVLVRGFREVGDIVVQILDERRVIIHGSILVELVGIITCGGDGPGQEAKQLVLGGMRLTCAFGSGKFGRKSWTPKSMRS